MSWESSIVYEQIINQEVRRRLGGLHSADLLIRSYDFAVVERLQVAGAWEQAGRLLAADARRLEGAGAHLLVLCTNTMHQVYDAIAAAVSIPLVHIADATAAAVRAAGLTRSPCWARGTPWSATSTAAAWRPPTLRRVTTG
jgi:aspartate racemase